MMLFRKKPIAEINMNNGAVIRVELDPVHAPNTVCNFIDLARRGFYDGLSFYRAVKGLMIQAGDPLENGLGGPGYCIRGEFEDNRFHNPITHSAGTISMARAIPYPDSAGSQFFITEKDAFHLDGHYAAFGKVIEGMDIVSAIASVRTNYMDFPMERQTITSVRVETFGKKYRPPKKITEEQENES